MLSIMLTDVQFSTQIETATKVKINNSCYHIPYYENCPDGTYFAGIKDGCQGPDCDKICCAVSNEADDLVLCGRMYKGVKGYNEPWGFYMDGGSLNILYRGQIASGSYSGLDLVDVQEKLDSTIPNGSEFCFPLQNSTRRMAIEGPDYCQEPLFLDSKKVFDPATNVYIQKTECAGDCKNIEGSFCFDLELENYAKEVDASLEEAGNKVDQMSDFELEDYLSENGLGALYRFDVDPEYVPTAKEIEDQIMSIAFGSSSSSSSQEEVEVQVAFDIETQSVSLDPAAPSEITLLKFENFVRSFVGGSQTENYFSFSIAPGLSVVRAYSIWGSTTGSGTMSIRSGSSWSGGTDLGSSSFGLNFSPEPLNFILPLTGGPYSLKVANNGASTEYGLLFIVESTGSSSSSQTEYGLLFIVEST